MLKNTTDFSEDDRFAFSIYKHFRATGAHEAGFDLSDLLNVSLQGDDIQYFVTRWGQASLSASEIPKEDVLESLYKMRIREPLQLQTVLAMYDQQMDRDRATPSYQSFKDYAKQTH